MSTEFNEFIFNLPYFQCRTLPGRKLQHPLGELHAFLYVQFDSFLLSTWLQEISEFCVYQLGPKVKSLCKEKQFICIKCHYYPDNFNEIEVATIF